MDCKWLETKLLWYKKYKAEEEKISTYSVEEMDKDKFWVCYCIRYKPIWSLEWILVRWRWNDRGIWTANWIFNDWIV